MPKQDLTQRTADLKVTELRASGGDDKPKKLQGYVNKFNTLSVDLGSFREIIKPGAFTKSLDSNDIRALYQHNSSDLLGRTSSNTLTLSEDDTGLRFELVLPDTQLGRDVYTLVERGDLTDMSFGFNVVNADHRTEDGVDIQEVTEADLHEISVVNWGAYPNNDNGSEVLAKRARDQFNQERKRRMRMRARLKTI